MEQQENKIEWTIHLARKYPRKFGIILMILAVMMMSAVFLKLTLTSIIVPILLIVSCGQFLFPIKYYLNEDRIQRKILFLTVELKWVKVKRFFEDKDSVWLSENRSKPFGGILLHLPDEKDDIIAYIKSHVKENNAS